jgi:hypothetical protein
MGVPGRKTKIDSPSMGLAEKGRSATFPIRSKGLAGRVTNPGYGGEKLSACGLARCTADCSRRAFQPRSARAVSGTTSKPTADGRYIPCRRFGVFIPTFKRMLADRSTAVADCPRRAFGLPNEALGRQRRETSKPVR